MAQYNTRILNKNDIEENWNKATNFIPKKGEIIVYNEDTNRDFPLIKVGDGVTNVINLPFLASAIDDGELGGGGGLIRLIKNNMLFINCSRRFFLKIFLKLIL